MTRRVLAAAALMLGLAAALVDNRLAGTSARAGDATAPAATVAYISAPDLADRIMQSDARLRLFDLRPRPDYEALHIPTARHATLAGLDSEAFPADAAVVIYADGGVEAIRGWTQLRRRGHGDVSVLRGGIYEWLARVHEPLLPVDATPEERAAFERAAEQSRFFGGQPRSGVARAEVPTGYWTTGEPANTGEAMTENQRRLAAAAATLVARVKRRGC